MGMVQTMPSRDAALNASARELAVRGSCFVSTTSGPGVAAGDGRWAQRRGQDRPAYHMLEREEPECQVKGASRSSSWNPMA